MRISTKLLHFFSALAISGAASASDFQGELQDQSRSIVEKTLSGMGRAKNSGQTWLNWTKYERGDRSVYASLMADAEAGSPDAMNVLGHILVEAGAHRTSRKGFDGSKVPPPPYLLPSTTLGSSTSRPWSGTERGSCR